MATKEKAKAVAELTRKFRDSLGAVVTEYRGLSVSQLQELRRSLGEAGSYHIVKNTLTKRAVSDAGIEHLDESLFSGPTAIAFITGDVVDAAKSIKDFSKDNKELVLKGGVLDGAALPPAEFLKMADLESREVLLAKLAGAMKGSMAGAAALFNAPLTQAARTIDALRAKAEADPSVLGGEATAPAEETSAADDAADSAEAPAEATADSTEATEEEAPKEG